MVLKGKMPSDATDVALDDESGCGEEIQLEVLTRPEPSGVRPAVSLNAAKLAVQHNRTTRLPLIRLIGSRPLVVPRVSSRVIVSAVARYRGRRHYVGTGRRRRRHGCRRANQN